MSYSYKDNNIEVFFSQKTGDTGNSGVFKNFPTFNTSSEDYQRYKSNEEFNAYKQNGTSMVQNAIPAFSEYSQTTSVITPPSWAKGVKLRVIGAKGDKGNKGAKGESGEVGDPGENQGDSGDPGEGGNPSGHAWAINPGNDQTLHVYRGDGGDGGDVGDGGEAGEGGEGGDGGDGGDGGVNIFEDIFLFKDNPPTISTTFTNQAANISFSTTGDNESNLNISVYKGSKGASGNDGDKGSKGGKGGDGGKGGKGADNVWNNGFPYQLNQHIHAHTAAADYVNRYGGNWTGDGATGFSIYYGKKGTKGSKGSTGSKGSKGSKGTTGSKGGDAIYSMTGSKSTGDKASSVYTATGDSETGTVELYYFATDDDYVDTT